MPAADEARALDFALRVMSSAGYGTLRHAAPAVPPDLEQRIVHCAIPESLVLSYSGGGVMVGANGSAFFYDQAVPILANLVLALRDGVPRAVIDILAMVDPASTDIVTRLLRDLVGAGALFAGVPSERGV